MVRRWELGVGFSLLVPIPSSQPPFGAMLSWLDPDVEAFFLGVAAKIGQVLGVGAQQVLRVVG